MLKCALRVFLGIMCVCATPLLGENGSVAIQNAASENKHLYIFFYKDQNDKTINLQKIFDQTQQKMGEQAKFVKIKSNDPSEKGLADRFNLKRTPMPFVLVLAPNGAITGSFFTFDEGQLKNALSSPGSASTLKALQDRKLVFISLQNPKTQNNEAALRGVRAFKADSRFGSAAEIVQIDPSDKQEQPFLKQIGFKGDTTQAVTILISPPAEVVGTYQGGTTKEQFIDDIQKASSGCCPGGCCPGGCCPGGKCGG